MTIEVRPYHPADLPAYYRICLATGKGGGDAAAFYDDADLLAHVYAAPYLQAEPELAWTAELGGRAVGYVLGTADTRRFEEYFRSQWIPVLRRIYPKNAQYKADQRALVDRIVWGQTAQIPDFCTQFPAHLHIDIAQEGQGKGLGRLLMEKFLVRLQESGVRGLHFGVDPGNAGALGFYRKLGFSEIGSYPGVIYFGREF